MISMYSLVVVMEMLHTSCMIGMVLEMLVVSFPFFDYFCSVFRSQVFESSLLELKSYTQFFFVDVL